MIKFMIKSNPYKREIEFYSYDNGEYIPITCDENSDLICDEITHSFFPYKVKEILDLIYKRYSKANEKIQLLFEGTDDEYQDLKELCSEEYNVNRFYLEPQEHYLTNASDILPDISRIFNEMKPLIEDSIRSNEEVALNSKKFEEAVNEQIIPICVIGNYSSGKSTFINALIGKEILQSGDDPVTDCVYKIMRSKNSETGTVKFEYNGLPIKFSLDESNRDSGCRVSGAGSKDDTFINDAIDNIRNKSEQPIHIRIHDLLGIIESHKKKRKRLNESKDISSLIEINIPFSKEGVLSQSECKYVIFDTPGEGSASNNEHSETLAEQMRSLTDGLIMYITDNKSLDKVEGKDLCEKLIRMECFDDRFTMIIVNKADDADLPANGFSLDDEEIKKSSTVSKTLNSSRLFYVSSIVGLGSKVDGEFINEKYEDTFDGCKERFSNPEHKRYKTLYKYNIVPEQIKKRCNERSLREHNKPFANSGLYWIEKEIMTFAETYSPYNKCTQSRYFLDEIIEATSIKIEESRCQFEETKKTLKAKLDDRQNACIDELNTANDNMWLQLTTKYPTHMQQIADEVNSPIKKEDLEERQSEIDRNIKAQEHYDEQKEEARFFKNSENNADPLVKDEQPQEQNGRKNFFGAISTGVKNGIQCLGETMQYIGETVNKKKEVYKEEKKIEVQVANILFEEKKKQYDTSMASIQQELDASSRSYWMDATEKFKRELIGVVTNSEGIEESKKEVLERIIANYVPLEFAEAADMLFEFDKLKQISFNILDVFFGDEKTEKTYKLNLRKFISKYNTSMNNDIAQIREKLQTSHEQSFREWSTKLVSVLTENIIEFNPELRKLKAQIDAQMQHINNLVNRKRRLEDYKLEIENLMSWN